MEKVLKLRLVNTKVDLVLKDREFYSYLRTIFEDYLADDRDADVISKFGWQDEFIRKNPLRLEKKPGYENFGPNIAIGKEGKHLEFLKKIHGRRFKTNFVLDGQKVRQEVYCHKKILKYLMNSLKKRPLHMDFFEISYFLFYYPLFWFMENFQGIYPMHASCVDTPKGGIIIAGLPGSGKTVTSLAVWNKGENNRFVSDNIILHDTKNVYSCPEPIRLHNEGKNLVEDDRLIRIDTVSAGSDKGFYRIRKDRTEQSRPVIFLLVKLSEEYLLKEIDTETAVNIAFSQNLQGAELLNYFEYASLAGFLNIKKNIFRDRMKALGELFKGLRCFSLSVPRKSSIDSTINNILSLLYTI